MRDYRLSRFFYEMQQADVRQRYAGDPDAVMNEYRLSPEVQVAVKARDVAFLSRLTNPYLLRFYFGYIGMPDVEFLKLVRATGANSDKDIVHG
jgi:hypothetical protein